ncbi:MAG TPA: aldo/keto reductase [Acidimicrobiales bacterium]|nr:aldo/keto reductase [Acidimicrobiales bacterium]
MEYRRIGDLSVSAVGIGCNNFGSRLDQDGTNAVVGAAIDSGITLFDTADIYGGTKSEEMLGAALGARRDDVVIATKFGMPIDDDHYGARPEYVQRACEASLKRLGTDRIDLYQLHAPDDAVPIADTLGALAELVGAGKVRQIGCSNLNAEQLREASAAAGDGPAFVSVQNQYSLLARDPERDGVLDECAASGLAFLPFYPLANGLLTGKVRPGEPVPEGTRLAKMPAERATHWLGDRLRAKVGELLDFAESVNTPLLILAVSWLLDHPEVASVIAGASTADQVRANAGAARLLAPGVRDRLDALTS